VLALVIGLRLSSTNAAQRKWRPVAAAALEQARLARDLALNAGSAPDTAERRAALQRQVDTAAGGLAAAASSAPDDAQRVAASSSAEALRGLIFAFEADRLLRDGVHAPTGEQLAQADQAIQDRRTQLDAALAALDRFVHPPT